MYRDGGDASLEDSEEVGLRASADERIFQTISRSKPRIPRRGKDLWQDGKKP